jgi:4-aminobutyrate aminotransferase
MPDKALGHYTHEKNPVACAAALAAIEVIESDHLLDNAVKMGNHAVERMKRMADTFPMIGDVRGKGLLMGMELLKDPVTAERAIEEAEGVYVCGFDERTELQDNDGQHPHVDASSDDQ